MFNNFTKNRIEWDEPNLKLQNWIKYSNTAKCAFNIKKRTRQWHCEKQDQSKILPKHLVMFPSREMGVESISPSKRWYQTQEQSLLGMYLIDFTICYVNLIEKTVGYLNQKRELSVQVQRGEHNDTEFCVRLLVINRDGAGIEKLSALQLCSVWATIWK